jgi:fatty acid desaturase
MHGQVIVRPIVQPSQRHHLPRVLAMLLVRALLLVTLAVFSLKAVLLYALAVAIELHVLNFFDSFHHTFAQYCIQPEQAIPPQGDRAYEQANTYSNVISARFPWLELLVLNFTYHNAHHHRPSVPWWRLPALHRSLYGETHPAILPIVELVRSWHRNRVQRVYAQSYGAPGHGPQRGDTFIGAHGVSFLTVV